MDKCANPEQEVIGFQIACVGESAVDIQAMSKLRAAKRPDSREKGAQTFILDVKTIEPFTTAVAGGPANASPGATHMQKMLKRIERRSNPIPELQGKLMRVVHGPHIEKGIELHPFKRRETAHLRWAVLAMWVLTLFGMALYGVQPGSSTADPLGSNQLHMLFIPIMIAFGLAFVLMLASRLSFSNVPLLQGAFTTGLFVLSSLPLLLSLLPSSVAPLRFPPYFPPLSNQFRTWVAEGEVLVSDQPWAIAWYADRKSLWMPVKISDLVAMNDYTSLGAPVAGVFLSPVTGHSRLFADVIKGEYKDWVQAILRSPGPTFPFKEAVPLPPDGEFIFFSDRKRWEPAR